MIDAHWVCLILALVCMIISIKPPATWSINWMTASFSFLILAWLVGIGAFHGTH